jgi:hypothetical protein
VKVAVYLAMQEQTVHQVDLVNQAVQEFQAHLVSQADHRRFALNHLSHRVTDVHLDNLVTMDHKENPDNLVDQANQADQEMTVHQARPDHKDHPDLQAKLDEMVLKVNQDALRFQHLLHLVMLAHPENQAHLVPQAMLVQQDEMVHQDSQDQKDLLAHQDHQVQLANLVMRVRKVHLVQVVREVFVPNTAHWMVAFSSRMEQGENKLFMVKILILILSY